MIVRSYRDSDLKRVDEIWKKFYSTEFCLPDLSNTITHAIIENDGIITGFGEVKLFAEALMVIDKDQSLRVKTDTARALIYKGINDSTSAGLRQLHVSVHDLRFAEVMEKHFGFERVKDIIMVRNL